MLVMIVYIASCKSACCSPSQMVVAMIPHAAVAFRDFQCYIGMLVHCICRIDSNRKRFESYRHVQVTILQGFQLACSQDCSQS